MKSNIEGIGNACSQPRSGSMGLRWPAALALLAVVFGLSACKTSQAPSQQEQIAAAAARADLMSSAGDQKPQPAGDKDALILREGDSVRITFPGAPNLNTVQVIRRDGKITMPLVGEVQAAGLTPTGLESKLVELYGPQLQTKEINVTLESSAFVVYVTGAVQRPGKIVSERQLTAFEAIVEAGGFNTERANLKKVRIIRYKDGQASYFTLNIKKVLSGKDDRPFMLKPLDILYVPERFAWF